MAKLGDFVAFQAAIALLKDTGRESVINEVYNLTVEQADKPKEEFVNHIKISMNLSAMNRYPRRSGNC